MLTFEQRKARRQREMEAIVSRICEKCGTKFPIDQEFLPCRGSELCYHCHLGQTESLRDLALTGPQLVALMRRSRITIRELAARMGITMSRVRYLRDRGCDVLARLDIEQAIAGEYTPRLRAMFRQYRKLEEARWQS